VIISVRKKKKRKIKSAKRMTKAPNQINHPRHSRSPLNGRFPVCIKCNLYHVPTVHRNLGALARVDSVREMVKVVHANLLLEAVDNKNFSPLSLSTILNAAVRLFFLLHTVYLIAWWYCWGKQRYDKTIDNAMIIGKCNQHWKKMAYLICFSCSVIYTV